MDVKQIKYNRLVSELKLYIKQLRFSQNSTFKIDSYSDGDIIINI